jgi:FMN phosphatase YigB (HAD superfamily)
MKRIKAIFFDAGGTLFEVRGSVGGIYSRIARRHVGICFVGVRGKGTE